MNLKIHFNTLLAQPDGTPLPDHATVSTRAGYIRAALSALETLAANWGDPTAKQALLYFPRPDPLPGSEPEKDK